MLCVRRLSTKVSCFKTEGCAIGTYSIAARVTIVVLANLMWREANF